jgi:hypothetical protein
MDLEGHFIGEAKVKTGADLAQGHLVERCVLVGSQIRFVAIAECLPPGLGEVSEF